METLTASQKAKHHMHHVSTTVGFYIAMCALRAEWNNVEDLHDVVIPSLINTFWNGIPLLCLWYNISVQFFFDVQILSNMKKAESIRFLLSQHKHVRAMCQPCMTVNDFCY
jgi:hypothetical protein